METPAEALDRSRRTDPCRIQQHDRPGPLTRRSGSSAPPRITAIRADQDLLDRLARGERPRPHDPDPVAAALAMWLVAVATDGAR
jgi:hypothetical protein